jgi:imidazole glycerol-phosphate synthase subunit HisF
MSTRRLVVCLDVKAGRVVKGVHFEHLKDMGDPVELAARYEHEGADEMVVLDISASHEERGPLLEVVRRIAETLFIPLTVGGGMRSVDDVVKTLRAGADKVSLNSAAVERPTLLTESRNAVGAQCVVASIDAKREGEGFRVYTHGGRKRTALEVIPWAQECVRLGAGEILLTSIDQDGARGGYDVELTRAVSQAVSVPVVASGGAGAPAHVVDVFQHGLAEAALVAGILHDGTTSVLALKSAMRSAGLEVRLGAAS